MSKKLYAIREKANKNHVIECDWQNAAELVSHGFWEWASGNASKEFQKAQVEARKTTPAPEGFDHLGDVPESEDSDDEDDQPVTAAQPEVVVEQVATVTIEAPEDLEDMTKEELLAHAQALGLSPDKRLGVKNLISAIRAAQGAAE